MGRRGKHQKLMNNWGCNGASGDEIGYGRRCTKEGGIGPISGLLKGKRPKATKTQRQEQKMFRPEKGAGEEETVDNTSWRREFRRELRLGAQSEEAVV